MQDLSPRDFEKPSLEEKFLGFYRQVDLQDRKSAERYFDSMIQELVTPACALIYKTVGQSSLIAFEGDLLNSLWMVLWENAHIPSRRWKQDGANPLTLSMSILKHKILDLQRKHYREQKVHYRSSQKDDSGWPFPDVAEKSLPQLEHMIRNERDEIVRKAIKSLPRKYANLLWCKYIRGMKSREIAILVGFSESTVSKRLTKADAVLRTALGYGDWFME